MKDESFFSSTESMHKVCTTSALTTAHLASHYMAQNGLLVFTGANAVFTGPQPSMIGYSVAKSATHHIANNMSSLETLPETSRVVTILPDTLDTPANREAMPDADHS